MLIQLFAVQRKRRQITAIPLAIAWGQPEQNDFAQVDLAAARTGFPESFGFREDSRCGNRVVRTADRQMWFKIIRFVVTQFVSIQPGVKLVQLFDALLDLEIEQVRLGKERNIFQTDREGGLRS